MAGPIGKAELNGAKAGLYECRELEREIAKAKECGLECTEQELRNEQLARFFQAILDQYTTGVQAPPNS